MARRLLILDYSVDRSEAPLIAAWLPGSVEVEVFRPAPGTAFPRPGSAEFAIHTGSSLSICDDAPFQTEAEEYIRACSALGVAQMGICYGHQLLARAFGGRPAVRKSPRGLEVGWGEVRFSPRACSLLGVPQSCRLFQYHFDEVISLPPGAEILAWNEHTLVQAFIDESRRLFGVQFHPEFDEAKGNAHFLKDRELLAGRGFDADSLAAGRPDPPADGRFFRFLSEHLREGR